MPFNPVTQNISGQLLGQGISQLGEGIAKGIERYTQEKENRDFLTKSIESKLGVALNEMQNFQANPKMYGGVAPITPEMLEQFQTAPGQSLGKLKAMNADLDVTLARSQHAVDRTMKAAQADQYQAHTRAINDELKTAESDRIGFAKTLSELSALPQGQFSGEDVFKIGAKNGLSPKAMETLTRAGQDLIQKQQAPKPPTVHTIDETGPNGEAFKVTYEYGADGNRKEVGRVRTDVQPGYAPVPGGGVKPIAGGPAEIKAKERDAAAQKDLERATAFKQELQTAISTAQEAKRLIQNRGAGGGFEGFSPVYNTMAAFGADATKVLDNKYSTLKSVLKLDKLAQMKELSKNGASGLGTMSDQEGESLESSVAKLDLRMSEKEGVANLDKIIGHLESLGGFKKNRYKIIQQP